MDNMNKNKSVSYEKQIVYTINLCYTKIITEKAIERG